MTYESNDCVSNSVSKNDACLPTNERRMPMGEELNEQSKMLLECRCLAARIREFLDNEQAANAEEHPPCSMRENIEYNGNTIRSILTILMQISESLGAM